MASGTGLMGYTSLVLVEGEYVRSRDTTQALFALRSSTNAPAGNTSGLATSGSFGLGNLLGFSAVGTGLMPVTKVVLVENPEWVRQPDRTQVLFQFILPQVIQPFTPPVNTSIIQQPGPGISVFNNGIFQYLLSGWSNVGPGVPTPITGLSISGSTAYGGPLTNFIPLTGGFIPQPGPGINPFGNGQFQSIPLHSGTTLQTAITVPITGLAVSTSTAYGPLVLIGPNLGFIPGPGSPSLGTPFNLNQFAAPPLATSSPSGLVTQVVGLAASGSVAYGALPGAAALSGLFASGSVSLGSLTGVAQGVGTGISVSGSISYGGLTGGLALSGTSASGSVSFLQVIGNGFIPLIPFTAVVDVRLNVGYQPWKVHKGGTIG